MFVDKAPQNASIRCINGYDSRTQETITGNVSNLNEARQLRVLRDAKSKAHLLANLRSCNRQQLEATVVHVFYQAEIRRAGIFNTAFEAGFKPIVSANTFAERSSLALTIRSSCKFH